MRIDISLKEKETKLLSAPNFSEYDGGNAFIFDEKIFHRHKTALGNGAYGEVFCFEADDHTKLAVKSESLFNLEYGYGDDFEKEANWYQQVYGFGVFSGDAKNHLAPHYILMPYFQGKTLYSFSYHSMKEVLFCWVKTADAINRLHQQHRVVHCDLKSDNIIIGIRTDKKVKNQDSEKAFVIDFGFATQIGMLRNIHLADTSENRKCYTQYAPEIFTKRRQKKLADPTQDIYSLGMLLISMQKLFYIRKEFSPDNLIENITKNLILKNPKERWSIPKAIFMIITSFFSQIPKEIWITAIDETALNKLHYSKATQSIWRATSKIAIQARCSELEMEQEALKIEGKKSERKAEKISGLKLLQSEIQIHRPELFDAIVKNAKTKFPNLTAGVFSRRTKTLMNELMAVAPVFH